MEFKLVIGDPKTGKCTQREIKEPDSKAFMGLKIGDRVSGDKISASGYEFEITGGSDYCGFPMRKDVRGVLRRKILLVNGVGRRKKRKEKGIRKKKTVCSAKINERISQVNVKIIKHGKTPLVIEKIAEKEKLKEDKPKIKEEKEIKKPKEEVKAVKEEKTGKKEVPEKKEEKPKVKEEKEKPAKEAPKEEKK